MGQQGQKRACACRAPKDKQVFRQSCSLLAAGALTVHGKTRLPVLSHTPPASPEHPAQAATSASPAPSLSHRPSVHALKRPSFGTGGSIHVCLARTGRMLAPHRPLAWPQVVAHGVIPQSTLTSPTRPRASPHARHTTLTPPPPPPRSPAPHPPPPPAPLLHHRRRPPCSAASQTAQWSAPRPRAAPPAAGARTAAAPRTRQPPAPAR